MRIRRGVLSRIREDPGSIAIQVANASDPELAAEALKGAGTEILQLDGGPGSAYGLAPERGNNPKYVSDVIGVPSGPILLVDGGFTPFRQLRQIPEIVARRLESVGVSAEITVPSLGGPLERLPDIPRAVFLRTYRPPAREWRARVDVPPEWLSEASGWILDFVGDDRDVMCSLKGVEFSAPLSDVAQWLATWERERPGYIIICSGDPAKLIRGVSANLTPDRNARASTRLWRT